MPFCVPSLSSAVNNPYHCGKVSLKLLSLSMRLDQSNLELGSFSSLFLRGPSEVSHIHADHQFLLNISTEVCTNKTVLGAGEHGLMKPSPLYALLLFPVSTGGSVVQPCSSFPSSWTSCSTAFCMSFTPTLGLPRSVWPSGEPPPVVLMNPEGS